MVGKARLQGLPPATIVNAEIDPLRSEGETLARRLQEAGVPVEQRTYGGVTHEFFGMAPAVADAVAAQDFVGDRLRGALGRWQEPRGYPVSPARRRRACSPGKGPRHRRLRGPLRDAEVDPDLPVAREEQKPSAFSP